VKPEVTERHACANCRKPFALRYREVDADEPRRPVAVKCPHCGASNRVQVASGAAEASVYWAERLGS
jgi:RNase P subunit RPR2